MRIMMVSSEAVPFAKTGGLADVATGLSNALDAAGHEVALVMPCYRRFISEEDRGEVIGTIRVRFPSSTIEAEVLRTALPGSGVQVLLVDCPGYFDRKGLYVESGTDYADNAERFLFFSRAAVEIARSLFIPDVIHANDWQTGLVPALIAQEREIGSELSGVGTVITIHNMAFQGQFPDWQMANTGLNPRYFNWEQLEFYGSLNLLKAGISMAGMVTTVSPTYAKEICEAEYGYGLDPVLEYRGEDLVGILNGVDMTHWNPAIDPHIEKQYRVDNFREGKRACKAALQREMGLPEREDAMLFGMITRLTDQKGLDLVTQKAGQILGANVQLVFLGTGEERYEQLLQEMQENRPEKVAAYVGFDEPLAHRIEAGADAYLMPSRFEPCGLNQQYSLIYGTPPIVHSIGGLADSVTEATPETIRNGTATGFKFSQYNGDEFLDTVWRAVGMFQHFHDDWEKLITNGMKKDSSWAVSAQRYLEVYQSAIAAAN